MQPFVLKQAQHIRVKPLSVNDRRTLPIVRVRPLTQIVQRPKSLIQRQIKSPHRHQTIQKRNPPPQNTPQQLHKLTKFKEIGFGKDLVIVSNGPSHKMATLDQLRDLPGLDIMSINKPDDRLWPTTYWLFCDNTQLNRHRQLWERYTGIIFNTPSVRERKGNCLKINSLNSFGFSKDLDKGVHIGRSSTYVAMQVAHWMNYDQVYIFGCDMGIVNGKLYPWGHNPDVADNTREKRFAIEASNYQWMADNLSDEDRKKFIFCSTFNKWPFLERFQTVDHETAVGLIAGRHKQT